MLPNRLFFCPVTIETDLNDSNHILFFYFFYFFMQVHQTTAEIFGPGFPRTGNTDPW